MQYAHLGRSGVLVSRLCLDTMNFGWETNEAEAIQIMDAALDSGINFMDTANAYGFLGLVAEQSQYNLTSRTPELEVISVCREYELGLVPYSPLSNGVLAGGTQDARQGRRADMKAKAKTLADKLALYFDLCEKIDKEPAEVAVARLLQNPMVTAPIIGPRTLEQFFDSLHALDIELDDTTMAKLDDIWPGPGGEAPEAYAW